MTSVGRASEDASQRRPPPSGRTGARALVRVLYIGGVGRSGSTLLDRMLGQIPGFCSVGELVHLWERGLAANNRCGCGVRFHACPFWAAVGREAFGGWDAVDVDAVLALKRRVDRSRYIPLLVAPALSPAYRADLDRYAALLGRLYGAIQRVAGAPILVDATKHVSSAYLLRRVPGLDLRVVHLVRDSRGVGFSWTKRVPRPEVVDGEALMTTVSPLRMGGRWLTHNGLFHLVRLVGVPSLLVRYETLVRHPRRELGRILEFAGQRPAGGELAFVGDGFAELGASHALAGNPMRFASGRVPLHVDEEWRRKLPPGQRALLLAATWPLLLSYGYLLHPHAGHDRPGRTGRAATVQAEPAAGRPSRAAGRAELPGVRPGRPPV